MQQRVHRAPSAAAAAAAAAGLQENTPACGLQLVLQPDGSAQLLLTTLDASAAPRNAIKSAARLLVVGDTQEKCGRVATSS